MDSTTLDALLSFYRALSDASRLRLVALLLERPRSVADLAQALNLTAPTVSHHLKRLAEAGLVEATVDGHYHVYRAKAEALTELSAKLHAASKKSPEAKGSDAKVLADFLVDGRLKTIPAQAKKRLVILRHIVEAFSRGEEYSEKQVNAMLKRYHEDVATLRRELVENGLMMRENGRYWRTRETRTDT
jgi:predicted transcriptional regulator